MLNHLQLPFSIEMPLFRIHYGPIDSNLTSVTNVPLMHLPSFTVDIHAKTFTPCHVGRVIDIKLIFLFPAESVVDVVPFIFGHVPPSRENQCGVVR